ncbi:MAG: cyclic diguanylate phosphodiesterase [Pseudomonadota bacterium]
MRDVVSNSSDASIIKTVIALGHNLNMTVIAEGVETQAQHQFLMDCGCELFQGYLFSKALPIEEFNAYVRSKLDLGATGAGDGNRTHV